jgi:predicted metal-dependent peptidase
VSRKKKVAGGPPDPATAAFEAGRQLVRESPLLAPLMRYANISRRAPSSCPDGGWAVVTPGGTIDVHPTRRGDPDEWAYVIAHCLLHLGFGHFETRLYSREWNDACDWFLASFQRTIKLGRPPADMSTWVAPPGSNEEAIYAAMMAGHASKDFHGCGAAGDSPDMLPHVARSWWGRDEKHFFQNRFAEGLADAVTRAVMVAGGELTSMRETATSARSPAERARRWFMSAYPLLGALAAGFKLIEDRAICDRLDITVAAVDAQARELFINPAQALSEAELRFVMAHELLHVGLRHDTRRQGRDPYLWNAAADYIINAWLVEMKVGTMPRVGGLYDPTLAGESAEALYNRMAADMRKYRKLMTMRGVGASDILERRGPEWWGTGDGVSLDDFYRSALAQGLTYHEAQGRGFLPAGLVEEIHALSQPPIPWDVQLARWFDRYFPPLELHRSYARPSRRQSSTPDIPLPRWVPPQDWESGRTFGVILDTSGSMDRSLLAKALGSIASYAISRDVPAVRVVFCDAATYDQGYTRAEDIAGEVRVRGRGGTILQPGVDLLERAEDFPSDGPILLITDGFCDKLEFDPRRPHAFLLPEGHSLPFNPKGELFYIR